MKVEIKSKEKNPSLHRTEIEFLVENAEKTPSRKELRDKIAALVDAKPELLIVDSLNHEFGTMRVLGTAKLYEKQEILNRVELEKTQRKNFPEKFVKKEENPEEKK